MFCILLSPANFYIKLPATRFDNTLSTRICGRIKCYREGESAIKTISPLQLAIQVVHKRLAGEQGTHCNGGSSLHLRGGGGRSFFGPYFGLKTSVRGALPWIHYCTGIRQTTEITISNEMSSLFGLSQCVSKTLFTWSGVPRSSGVGFFCFVSPRA